MTILGSFIELIKMNKKLDSFINRARCEIKHYDSASTNTTNGLIVTKLACFCGRVSYIEATRSCSSTFTVPIFMNCCSCGKSFDIKKENDNEYWGYEHEKQ